MMLGQRLKRTFMALGVMGMWFLFPWSEARAVPSFHRQTNLACTACHTVFPELTPLGRIFKLTGYTFSKDSEPYQIKPPPVTAEAQISFTNIESGLTNATFLGIRENDNVMFPQLLNFYYAGQVLYRLGAFVQVSFEDLNRHWVLGKADARWANTFNILGKDLILGVTYNNYPTVQDVWNTTPVFGFPYLRSFVAPSPALTLLEGTLDSQIGGLGGYFLWNNLIYGELTFYRTAANSYTQPLSAGVVTTTFLDGVAPYWRLAVQHVQQRHSFSLGTYGIVANTFLGNNTRGRTDQFADFGFDAQYQYILPKHVFSAQVNYIYEAQNLGGSLKIHRSAYQDEFLSSFKANLNYHYRSKFGTFGGIFGIFVLNGSSDPFRLGAFDVNGSRLNRPNSNGYILQADYLPLDRVKISVQYVIYQKFNGDANNYDGRGRAASENNTLFIFARLLI